MFVFYFTIQIAVGRHQQTRNGWDTKQVYVLFPCVFVSWERKPLCQHCVLCERCADTLGKDPQCPYCGQWITQCSIVILPVWPLHGQRRERWRVASMIWKDIMLFLPLGQIRSLMSWNCCVRQISSWVHLLLYRSLCFKTRLVFRKRERKRERQACKPVLSSFYVVLFRVLFT